MVRHYLESVDKYIESGNEGLDITSDILYFSSYIKKRIKDGKKGKLLDIGSGIGSLSFLLSNEKNLEDFFCVEIQNKIFDILSQNVKDNKLNWTLINDNVMNMEKEEYFEYFDYIISNPPFYKLNSGKLPKDESIKISKFEVYLTLENLFNVSMYMLKNGGSFFLILPDFRFKELENLVKKNKEKILIDNIEHIKYIRKKFFMIHLKKIQRYI